MQWCVDMWSKPSPSLERGVLCLSLAPVRPFGRFGTGSRRLAGEERDGKAEAGRHQTHWQLGVGGSMKMMMAPDCSSSTKTPTPLDL